jgi:hypothetical protein
LRAISAEELHRALDAVGDLLDRHGAICFWLTTPMRTFLGRSASTSSFDLRDLMDPRLRRQT